MKNSPRITVTQTQEPRTKEENISTKIIRLENHLKKSLQEPETLIELYSQSDDAEMILNYITQERSIASKVLTYVWKKTGEEMRYSPGNFLSPPYASPLQPKNWAPPGWPITFKDDHKEIFEQMMEPVRNGYWEIHKFKSYLDLDPDHFFDEGSIPILIPSDNLPKDRFVFVFTRQDKGWINQIPSVAEIEISDQYNKKQKFIFINLESDSVASIDPQYSRFVHDKIAVFITNDSGEIIEKNIISEPVDPRSRIII